MKELKLVLTYKWYDIKWGDIPGKWYIIVKLGEML